MNSCLIVIQNLTRSGSPQTFLHVIKALKEKGFIVDAFVYAVRDDKVDLYFYEQYKEVCRNIFISRMRLNGLSYKMFPLTKFGNIKKTIKKNQYDLIISNNIYFMADCSKHKNKLKYPKLIYYALGNVNIKSKHIIIRKKEKYIRKYIKGIDAYIALSSIAVPVDDIVPEGRLYSLMDYPDVYYPNITKKPAENEIVLGQIGYYCHNKNQLFSLEVLKELISRGEQARLLFVGFKLSEEPQYFDEMQKFIKKNCLSSFVTFLPSDYDKKDLFEQIHALLLPSLHEGLAIALMEAQFSNTYCVASNNVPVDVDFGLCSFSKLELETWLERVLAVKTMGSFKPHKIYQKQDFQRIFDIIITDVFGGITRK